MDIEPLKIPEGFTRQEWSTALRWIHKHYGLAADQQPPSPAPSRTTPTYAKRYQLTIRCDRCGHEMYMVDTVDRWEVVSEMAAFRRCPECYGTTLQDPPLPESAT